MRLLPTCTIRSSTLCLCSAARRDAPGSSPVPCRSSAQLQLCITWHEWHSCAVDVAKRVVVGYVPAQVRKRQMILCSHGP
jgi:hypothetical protein